MLNLDTEDRQHLSKLLQGIPDLSTESSRIQILELAGLKDLVPKINHSGSTFVAVNNIVSYLSGYGRLNYEHEALGLFLNLLKSMVGIEEKEIIDNLLIKYDMMTPIVSSPSVVDWKGVDTSAQFQEKIIGENTLRPIAFFRRGLEVSNAVSYIGVNDGAKQWSGTGFLITSDLLLTCNHVLGNVDILSSTIFRFNYEESFSGEAQTPQEYRATPNGIFHTNQELDYTIVQLQNEPGHSWNWLTLEPKNVMHGDRVNIIQHPGGRHKHISIQNNYVEYVGNHVVQYVTATEPGSSGSPVLNDQWAVVALHHAGGNLREPTTQRTYFRNEGILIGHILDDLPVHIMKML